MMLFFIVFILYGTVQCQYNTSTLDQSEVSSYPLEDFRRGSNKGSPGKKKSNINLYAITVSSIFSLQMISISWLK